MIHCIFRKNLILKDVEEERWVDSSVYNHDGDGKNDVVVAKRRLSQAMIPGNHLVKVQVSRGLYEENVPPVLSAATVE